MVSYELTQAFEQFSREVRILDNMLVEVDDVVDNDGDLGEFLIDQFQESLDDVRYSLDNLQRIKNVLAYKMRRKAE